MFPLVVDINVVLSSLLGVGDSLLVFDFNYLFKRYDLIAPYYFIIELNKHTSEIAQRSKLSINEATKLLHFITKQIRFVSEDEFSDKFTEARKILGEHDKDIHYLALAIKKNCNIFSGDKVFKELCPDKIKTPKELLDEFFEREKR